ncbi:hypothetical protein NYP18_09070 [Corynebacterium sp. YIM 101645]|uniref:Uncharacterized protein n=1 Tax=Corynebacterium lemuris TaxID=1859292 RepID=A0ABT2FYF1_9CORY|nr:hypothetical protein [Corynebacterium lemuris]MCS5479810.1 hypothetical protein [Corynebacterium lemuris]
MSPSLNTITLHLDDAGDLARIDTLASDPVVMSAAVSVIALILGSAAGNNPTGAEDARDYVIREIDRRRVIITQSLKEKKDE